jgi:hypothetical protein
MEHAFYGQAGGGAWTGSHPAVDDTPPSVDIGRLTVDRAGTKASTRRYNMLRCDL